MSVKYLFIIMVLMLGLCSACTVVPRSETRAKKVIAKKKKQIDKIAKYHNLSSIWTTRKDIVVPLPSITREIKFEYAISREVVLDSVVTVFKEDGNVEKFKENIINNFIVEDFTYEDSLIRINIIFNLTGHILEYDLKERNELHSIEYEGQVFDIGLPYYKQKMFWVIVFLFILIISYLLYLLSGKGLSRK
jgi:hypothetical protein